jgi:hypothetical protein
MSTAVAFGKATGATIDAAAPPQAEGLGRPASTRRPAGDGEANPQSLRLPDSVARSSAVRVTTMGPQDGPVRHTRRPLAWKIAPPRR